MQGGSSFSVNCTPTASFSGSAPMGQLAGGSIAVGYTAIANPITVNLAGKSVDVDGSWKALTGQQITATLNSPYTSTNYAWSVSGATSPNPFKTWDPTWPNSSNPTQFVALTANDMTRSSFGFYDVNDRDSVIVQCITSFMTPDNVTHSVTVTSSPIQFFKPTATWDYNKPYNPSFRHPIGFFNDASHSQFGAHETWGAINISVPNPFSGGIGCIIQIANLDRGFARNAQNGKPGIYSKLTVLSGNATRSMVNSPTGLDVDFPYPYGYTKNTDGSFTLVNTKYTWTVGNIGFSDDQPYISYTTADVDMGGTLWYDATANDHFNTWVMYQPPSAGGQPTIYVPLQTLAWSWGGSADLIGGVWNVAEGPPFNSGNPSITNTYPAWTLSIPSGFSVGP